MRYEAIGCGIYEVDPTTKPGDPRNPVACTGDDIENDPLEPGEYAMIVGEQLAMATRIAVSLNGSEELVAALGKIYDNHEYETPAGTTNCRFCDNNTDHDGTYADMHAPDCVVNEIRAALSAAEPAEVVG